MDLKDGWIGVDLVDFFVEIELPLLTFS